MSHQARIARLERLMGSQRDRGGMCCCPFDYFAAVSVICGEPHAPETCQRCGRPLLFGIEAVAYEAPDDRSSGQTVEF